MANFEDKRAIMEESWRRVTAMEFGQPVTNICAGDGNPRRHAYFVKAKTNSRKNRFGVVHRDRWARCTDKKGSFWDASIEVTYPGHLSPEEARRLYEPVHAATF